MPLLESIAVLDQKVLLAINGMAGHHVIDQLMSLVSNKLIWIPLYSFVLYSILAQFGLKNSVWIILGSLALIVLTDQASVLLFKEIFVRERPCHVHGLKEVLILKDGYCGGNFGFISSHAANVTGLATFWYLIFNKVSRFWSLLFVWSTLVCFSRVYLGVHYPMDVLVGSLFGGISGSMIYRLIHSAIQ